MSGEVEIKYERQSSQFSGQNRFNGGMEWSDQDLSGSWLGGAVGRTMMDRVILNFSFALCIINLYNINDCRTESLKFEG